MDHALKGLLTLGGIGFPYGFNQAGRDPIHLGNAMLSAALVLMSWLRSWYLSWALPLYVFDTPSQS